jgi:hypothetical protein
LRTDPYEHLSALRQYVKGLELPYMRIQAWKSTTKYQCCRTPS